MCAAALRRMSVPRSAQLLLHSARQLPFRFLHSSAFHTALLSGSSSSRCARFATRRPPLPMHPTCIIKPPTNTTAAPSSTSTSSSDDGAADVTSRLKAELKASMKAAKKARVTVIKSLLSDLTYASKQAPPVEPELVIQRALKRRMDSIESYTQSGHLDLVQSEQAEVAIIQEFLPKQLGQDELEAIVRSVAQKLAAKSPKDMGPVMKQVILELPSGSATRKDISDTVKRVLSSL